MGSTRLNFAAAVAAVGVLGILLSGCAPRAVADFDLRTLDGVPAAPIVTATGLCTGLLRDDGTILTCSHALPRGEHDGEVWVAGHRLHSTVIASGDGLEDELVSGRGVVAEGTWRDWAVLRTSPVLEPGDLFTTHLHVPASLRPPAVGETLFVVGYTRSGPGDPSQPGAGLERLWVPVVVVAPPTSAFARTSEGVIWLRVARVELRSPVTPPASPHGGALGNASERGLSGAPVLRALPGGGFEICAIYVAGENRGGSGRGRFGVAIPLP